MDRARLVKSDESKRRKTNDPGTENTATDIEKDLINNSQELTFTVTSLGGLPDNLITHLREQEKEMIEDDLREVSRQEAKNLLEETLYKVRGEVLESSEGLETEEAVTNIKIYFDQIETWLYEEGEDVPEQSYRESLKQLEERVKVFYMWRSKLMELRAREQERRVPRRPSPGGVLESGRQSRQIPVVYEGGSPYTRQPSARPHSAPRRHMMEDPFFSRSSFYNDPLFGW